VVLVIDFIEAHLTRPGIFFFYFFPVMFIYINGEALLCDRAARFVGICL